MHSAATPVGDLARARTKAGLGALTIAASQRLGGDTFMVEEDSGVRQVRMARVNDNVDRGLAYYVKGDTSQRHRNVCLLADYNSPGAQSQRGASLHAQYRSVSSLVHAVSGPAAQIGEKAY